MTNKPDTMPIVFHRQGKVIGIVWAPVIEGRNDRGETMYLIDSSTIDPDLLEHEYEVITPDLAQKILGDPQHWVVRHYGMT